jgi:predicted nucleotide-binding protein
MGLEEAAVEEAMYNILEAARDNNWELHWFEHDHGSVIQVNNRVLAQNQEDEKSFHEAAYRMLNERSWIRRDSGILFKVTQAGRDALSSRASQIGPTDETGGKIDVDLQSVFVVHGRDDSVRKELELYLHRLDLNPVVLFQQTSGGKRVRLNEGTKSLIGILS